MSYHAPSKIHSIVLTMCWNTATKPALQSEMAYSNTDPASTSPRSEYREMLTHHSTKMLCPPQSLCTRSCAYPSLSETSAPPSPSRMKTASEVSHSSPYPLSPSAPSLTEETSLSNRSSSKLRYSIIFEQRTRILGQDSFSPPLNPL